MNKIKKTLFLRRAAKTVTAVTAAIVMLAGTTTAQAESFTGADDWHVAFTPEAEMESNFKTSDLDEAVSGLQPGDDIVFTMKLKNEHESQTNWYMTNEVLYSLEDRSANSATGGGAYTYELYYYDKSGTEKVLFSSNTVGGEVISVAGEGMHEATDSLKDFFYLDTLAQGDSGEIRLRVALDGETQGNDYQDTLADLQMNFAVELSVDAPEARTDHTPSPEETTSNVYATAPATSGRVQVVKTGDDSQSLLWMIIAAVSGVVLLSGGIYGVRQNRKRKEAV